MNSPGLRGDEPDAREQPSLMSFALQAVMDLQDRTVFGFTALPRGDLRPGSIAFVCAALSAVHYTTPGLLFVPLAEELVADETFDPSTRAEATGVAPAEVAWLIDERTSLEAPDLFGRRIAQLRSQGFQLALTNVGPGVLARGAVSELLPNFVFLDPSYIDYVSSGVRARAELSGLLAYCARLNTHVIPSGIADDAATQRLIGLGVRLGTGAFLGAPAVLEASWAEPGDEVVSPVWFRKQGVRALSATGVELNTPAVIATIPVGETQLDAQGFAWSLGEAARKMQAEHDPVRILQVTAEHLPLSVQVDRFAIFEADWDRYKLRPRVLGGGALDGLHEMDISLDRGITGWAFLRGYPYNCPDTRSHTEALPIPGQDASTLEESMLVVPLIAGDHRLGVIDMWRNGLSQFTQEDLERCALFGHITAAAWRNAQLYAELERRAMTDTLTGLLNNRWWDELAAREAARSVRAGSEIGILLIDLDHFKRVNDRCGHAAGDVVLRNVGRAFQSVLRAGDAAVRYGGEEFLLMLSDADEIGAMRVAESVQDVLTRIPEPGNGVERVTASIGVAFFPRHGAVLDDVVNVADRAMYRAKALGRNRIVFAPDPPWRHAADREADQPPEAE